MKKREKKKILVVMDSYPPTSSPNDICMDNVIQELKINYTVFCLVKKKMGDKKYKEVDGVNVISYSKGPIDSFISWGLEHQNKLLSKAASTAKFLLTRANQLFTIPIYPIFWPFYQIRLAYKLLKECRKNNIHAVIAVCFPPESLFAGRFVKNKIRDLVYIPYFIDAYSCGTYPKYISYEFAFSRKLGYEKWLTDNADEVIMMESSQSFHQKFSLQQIERYTFLNPPFLKEHDVEVEDFHPLLEEGKINIVYTGYLYLPDRDPSYIIDLISSWNRKDVVLIFVGGGNCSDIIESKKPTFNGTLKHSNFLPHDEILTLLAGANVLLNLGVSNSNAISGKIFEYMSFGKPILTTYFKDDDASLMYLDKYPLSFTINQTQLSIEEASVESLVFVEKHLGEQAEFGKIEKIFYNSTPEAVVRRIREHLP
ncbi:TPA: hypothetical protein U0603_001134 [Streptococcus suis]|nr:hypothetical protein [Streptococcus suis]